MQARLVGTQRHWRIVVFELIVPASRQRLLDELHTKLADGGPVLPQFGKTPSLVDVDNQPNIGSRLPYGSDAFDGPVVIELYLEQRSVGGRGCARSHLLRLGLEPDREHGQDRVGFHAGHLPGRGAAQLRLEIPEGGVGSVASPAGRQQFQQILPTRAGRKLAADRFELPEHRFLGFIEVIHAKCLAPTDDAMLLDLAYDARVVFPHIIRNPERDLAGPGLDVIDDAPLHTANSNQEPLMAHW